MKKGLLMLGTVLVAVVIVATDLFAGLVYRDDANVAFLRTQSRNATTGSVEAAYYSPMGLVQMEEGLYLDTGNIMFQSKRSWSDRWGADTRKRNSETIRTKMVPYAALIFNVEKGSVFYTMDVRQGGGTVKWTEENFTIGHPDVHPTINTGGKLEVTEATVAHTIGGAFEVVDNCLFGKIVFASGLRYFDYHRKEVMYHAYGHYKLRAVTHMDGYAPFVGVMFTPVEMLNFTVQYQGKTKLYGTTQTRADFNDASASLVADYDNQDASRELLPTTINLGAAWILSPRLEVMVSYNRQFSGEECIAGTTGQPSTDTYVHAYKNKDYQRLGLGVEFQGWERFLVSGGVSYIDNGIDPRNNNVWGATHDALVIGVGGKFNFTERIDLSFAVAYPLNKIMYSSTTDQFLQPGSSAALAEMPDRKMERRDISIGFGLGYKIF